MIEQQIDVGMSLEDYMMRFDQEGRFEILDGQVIALSPTIMIHIFIAKRIEVLLEKAAPKAFVIREAPFVLHDKSDWVKGSRVPDVLYIEADRFEAYKQANPDWLQRPLSIVPDLVVEVVSPGDNLNSVDRQVDLYLQDGVKLIWVVNPQRGKVYVHTSGLNTITVYQGDDTITGGAVMPDFKVKASDILS
jgi:Uma2 family endonuclease